MTDSKWVPIRDEIEAIFSVGADFIAPIAAVALMIPGLNVPAGAIIALESIPVAMQMAQKISPEKGTGPARKTMVLGGLKVAMDFADTKLTGGAKSSYETLLPLISAAIDGIIGLVSQVAPKVIAPDPPGPPAVGSGIHAPIDGA